MGISRNLLSDEENKKLYSHLNKHKIYPFAYRFRKLISATAFTTADGALGSYFTLTFTPTQQLGIISLATNYIILPNTSIGAFSMLVSYRPVITMSNNTALGTPDDESNEIYELKSNGGAINDFQVFFPLTWYVETGKSLYIHFWADAATVTAGTATVVGRIILGTMLTNLK